MLSRRDKPQLYYQGYLFNSDSFKNGRVYWRCSETRRGTCIARVLTTDHNLIEKQPIHDHPPNEQYVEGKKIISLSDCYAYFSDSQKIKNETNPNVQTEKEQYLFDTSCKKAKKKQYQ